MSSDRYDKAFELGFAYYGVEGLLEMHRDVCNEPENPWGYGLAVLNELDVPAFEKLAGEYQKRKNMGSGAK